MNNKLSIIVPVKNECENISKLCFEISLALNDTIEYECIWVDDVSTDNTWFEITKIINKKNKGIRFAKNYGQSAALMAGIEASKNSLIVTLDGDLQNDPTDILMMLDQLTNDLDLVQGVRQFRKDNIFLRRIPSLVANLLSKLLFKNNLLDLGCTLRIFRKEIILKQKLMGEMHRIFGLYLIAYGARYIEVNVNHRPRKFGKSKYGLSRTYKFIADITLLKLMGTLTNKPLYLFFRLAGFTLFMAGTMISSAFLLKFTGIKDFIDSVFIVGGLILFSTSVILVGLGLIAEITSRLYLINNPSGQFIVKQKIGFN